MFCQGGLSAVASRAPRSPAPCQPPFWKHAGTTIRCMHAACMCCVRSVHMYNSARARINPTPLLAVTRSVLLCATTVLRCTHVHVFCIYCNTQQCTQVQCMVLQPY